MTTDLLMLTLFGHLIGDYLLQSKEMALRKSERSWLGFWLCSLHVSRMFRGFILYVGESLTKNGEGMMRGIIF